MEKPAQFRMIEIEDMEAIDDTEGMEDTEVMVDMEDTEVMVDMEVIEETTTIIHMDIPMVVDITCIHPVEHFTQDDRRYLED